MESSSDDPKTQDPHNLFLALQRGNSTQTERGDYNRGEANGNIGWTSLMRFMKIATFGPERKGKRGKGKKGKRGKGKREKGKGEERKRGKRFPASPFPLLP